jgi:hypothetical protein
MAVNRDNRTRVDTVTSSGHPKNTSERAEKFPESVAAQVALMGHLSFCAIPSWRGPALEPAEMAIAVR